MKLLLIISAILCITSVCYSQEYIQNYKSDSGDHKLDYIDRIIVVTGTGASGKEQKSLAEKKVWAMTEARKNCITQAALAVSRVKVSSKTLLKNGKLSETSFSLKIRTFVSGIRDISGKYDILDDGSVLATASMIIKFDGNKGINDLIFNQYYTPADEKEHGTAYSKHEYSSKDITGVVLDVRELPIQPSIDPCVYDDNGELIYGPGSVSREYLVKYGIAGYTTDLKNVRDRIGDNPVILKVKSLKRGDSASIIIAAPEKERLIELQEKYSLLNNCRVVFLINK
ncbi:MAG: hypothetical protein GY863_12170 [bacterium]|nr:hypothetical protein [bacterium]